jgi:hypothetical protein
MSRIMKVEAEAAGFIRFAYAGVALLNINEEEEKGREKMFIRINAMLRGFKYSIIAAISFERAISGMKRRRWFSHKGLKKGELFKLNPWIEYIARRAKLLTKRIIDQANCGIIGPGISIGMLAISIEEKETKKRS